MSLGKMLTKVAIGFAVAKGIQAVSKSASRGGGSLPPGAGAGTGTRIEREPGAAPGGSIGDLLGGLTGARGGQAGGNLGGLGDLIAGRGGAGSIGGLGGLLGGLAANRSGEPAQAETLEDILGREAPKEEPPAEDNAGLMIRAMVMAARCDGEIDGNEKETLMATIGEDATPDDIAFVKAAMDEPVDARKIAAETPEGLETQLYSMSLMAIEPDHPEEAKYLHTLASSLGIGQATVNEIHDSFGVPRLYS